MKLTLVGITDTENKLSQTCFIGFHKQFAVLQALDAKLK